MPSTASVTKQSCEMCDWIKGACLHPRYAAERMDGPGHTCKGEPNMNNDTDEARLERHRRLHHGGRDPLVEKRAQPDPVDYKALFEQCLYHLRCVSASRNSFELNVMTGADTPCVLHRSPQVEKMHQDAVEFLKKHDR